MEKEFTLTKQFLPDDGKVLIIEDDLSTLRLIEIILEREGIEYMSACGATKAIEIEEDRDNCIRAIITDVVLVDGSGISIAREIHSKNPEMPILFSTSVDDPSTSNLMWQHGMVYHKPIREDFPAAIRRLIMCANKDTGMFGNTCSDNSERRYIHRRQEDTKK